MACNGYLHALFKVKGREICPLAESYAVNKIGLVFLVAVNGQRVTRNVCFPFRVIRVFCESPG